MGTFRQLGDPVCPPCLCQHHGAEYAERIPLTLHTPLTPNQDLLGAASTIVSDAITITEQCCVVVNAAVIVDAATAVTRFEIERPIGTVRTLQEDSVLTNELALLHLATWEVLPAGIHTYFLQLTAGPAKRVYAAWLKVIASDCEA